MADLSKIRLNGTTYNLKDAEARSAIEDLREDAISNLPLATPERNGFVAVEWGGTEIK